MKVAGILALAALAGAAVYTLSLRSHRGDDPILEGGEPETSSGAAAFPEPVPFRDGLPPDAEDESDTFAFERSGAPRQRSWQMRLVSALGLIVMVALAGMTIAAALWLVGHLANQELAKFLQR